MEPIIGFTVEDLDLALYIAEKSVNNGDSCRLQFCTESLPSKAALEQVYADIILSGHHITMPVARTIDGVPTTTFDIKKGSPQWQIIIPILVPLFTIGLITFGIFKLESITKALLPILLVVGGVIIVTVGLLARPAERVATAYLSKGGQKLLPSTIPISQRKKKPFENPHEQLNMLPQTELKDRVKELWRKACEWEGIPPESRLVTFSEDNPFMLEYQEAILKLLRFEQLKSGRWQPADAGEPTELPGFEKLMHEMALWYIKNRRHMTLEEMRAIIAKWVLPVEDRKSFYLFLKSTEGYAKFRSILREEFWKAGLLGPEISPETILPATEIDPPGKFFITQVNPNQVKVTRSDIKGEFYIDMAVYGQLPEGPQPTEPSSMEKMLHDLAGLSKEEIKRVLSGIPEVIDDSDSRADRLWEMWDELEAESSPQTEPKEESPQPLTPKELQFSEVMWQSAKELKEAKDPSGSLIWDLIQERYPGNKEKQIRFLGFMGDFLTEQKKCQPKGVPTEVMAELARKWGVEAAVAREALRFFPGASLLADKKPETVLTIVCIYCKKKMGEEPGGGVSGETASICRECWEIHFPGEPYPEDTKMPATTPLSPEEWAAIPEWQRKERVKFLVATPKQAEALRSLQPYEVVKKYENRDWRVTSGGKTYIVTAEGKIHGFRISHASPQTTEVKHYWVEKNLPYDTWAVIEVWPGGLSRSPFKTKEEAIEHEKQIGEGIYELKLVPSPQEKFPKQHATLKKLYPYEFIEYHKNGDITVQLLVPKSGAKLPVSFHELVKGDVIIVATDGRTFKDIGKGRYEVEASTSPAEPKKLSPDSPEGKKLLDPKLFPKRTEALNKLGAYTVLEVHDDGDLTVQSYGKQYVVTTEGEVFAHFTPEEALKRITKSPSMSVKLWTGKAMLVKDRDEAVKVIKEEMQGWMQKGDKLIWYNTEEDDKLGRKPSFAVVVNEVGEETDASAMILYFKPRGSQAAPKYQQATIEAEGSKILPFSGFKDNELTWTGVFPDKTLAVAVKDFVSTPKTVIETAFRKSKAILSNIITNKELPLAAAGKGEIWWLATIGGVPVEVHVIDVEILSEIALEDMFNSSVAVIKESNRETMERIESKQPAVIPTQPAPRLGKDGDLEYIADSPEYLAQTIDMTGWRQKIDQAFQEAVERVKGPKET